MDIQREQEIVEAFNYGLPPAGQKIEQQLDVDFDILSTSNPNYPDNNSIIGVRVKFVIPAPEFIVSGSVSQVIHVIDRQIEKKTDFSRTEANQIALPVFKIIERLVYDVTEIALDRPGIKINFAPNE